MTGTTRSIRRLHAQGVRTDLSKDGVPRSLIRPVRTHRAVGPVEIVCRRPGRKQFHDERIHARWAVEAGICAQSSVPWTGEERPLAVVGNLGECFAKIALA